MSKKCREKVIAVVLMLVTMFSFQSNVLVKADTYGYTMYDSSTDTTLETKGTYQLNTKVDITAPPTLYWEVYSHGSYANFAYNKNKTSYSCNLKYNNVTSTINAIGFSSVSTDGFEFEFKSTSLTIKSTTKKLSYNVYGVAYGGLVGYKEVAKVKYVLKKNGKDKATVVLTNKTAYGF